jgi:hypothetical protein
MREKNYVSQRVQIMKHFIIDFSAASFYLLLLRYKYFPSQPLLKDPEG